jgi:hypothetical protein
MTVLTTHNDRPERSNGAKRNGAARVLVTAGALAAHLSCVSSYIAKLVDQGILERRSDGRFDQDQCRAKYIAHLKEERKRSRRLAANAEFTSAKAELIRIRILERKKALVPAEEAYARMDQLVGMFLTGLSRLGARIGGRDLAARRVIGQAVFDLRREISEAATKLAEAGEPVLDDA